MLTKHGMQVFTKSLPVNMNEIISCGQTHRLAHFLIACFGTVEKGHSKKAVPIGGTPTSGTVCMDASELTLQENKRMHFHPLPLPVKQNNIWIV